ncbi:DUF2442 domain-containing protein [Romeria aff. gracilis LEGE 07310]|uniref:DUF2442 domain-containing protein n=1 Tax=Vasconcelosia minhoensis LEGE 07310 TaxID=915328 RepID=A0A8J7A9V3_9CYAN|nr:DUF2442 domain-containing protein [Romeria gracilis]MBE9075809.1 DUF2442 domain-containing protein [Romeria aff. gracilis LEGE 07310]
MVDYLDIDAAVDAEIAAARAEGQRQQQTQHHAQRAYYNRATRRLHIETTAGIQRSFDVNLLQGVAGGSESAIANIEIMGNGMALHWPELDADLLVHSLMQGVYGTEKWMNSLVK